MKKLSQYFFGIMFATLISASSFAQYDSSFAPICPVCGDTANYPNKSLAIGNDDPYFGDVCWVPAIKVFLCPDCGNLFVREKGKKYKVRKLK